MLRVMILFTLVKKRAKGYLLPITEGPVCYEMESILYSQSCFQKTWSYFYFVTNFYLRRKFSLVCHAVWLYNDVFHCGTGTELIKNRLFLMDASHSNLRGGSSVTNIFVLLCWVGLRKQDINRIGLLQIWQMGFQSIFQMESM